jgi:hypothetical protein
MHPLICFKKRTPLFLVAFALGGFALCPMARAVDPPPDGGYPGQHTAEGEDALFSLIVDPDCGKSCANTAVGFHALYSDTTGSYNTAIGSSALEANTSESDNTAVGFLAMSQWQGSNNTATGAHALFGPFLGPGIYGFGSSNTAYGDAALADGIMGNNNTAVGASALRGTFDLDLTNIGDHNTAMGFEALAESLGGNNNTAVGAYTLRGGNTGDNNTAMGFQALYSNTAGIDNTAAGLNALFGNTEGNENTANGHSALQNNTTGNDNTAVGHDALFNNTTGSNNIALGHGAGSNLTTGSNNIDIGFFGVPGEANTIRIGTQGTQTKTFVAGIAEAGIMGLPVKVNGNGQLGTTPSSARFKQNIKPMDKASEVILALKPVTFRYKPEIDPARSAQFGLVAEQVEEVNPDLVVRDKEGKVNTVRYDAVNAMLLNEFLKEHKEVEEQRTQITHLTSEAAKHEDTIRELKNEIGVLTAQFKEQSAELQRIADQLELAQPAPQMVAHN